MNTGWSAVIVVFLLIVAGAIALVVIPAPQEAIPTTPPKSFAECIKYFTASGTTPRTCTTNLGQVFTEDLGNAAAMADIIVVETPRPNTKITSPISIVGKARGMYFFEGNFPIEIQSQSGTVLGRGSAEALQSWTTPDFVRFKATITFDTPSFGSNGFIVFKNSNPSGDPNLQKELEVPVSF